MQNNLSNQGNPLNFLNNIKGLRIASLNVNSIVSHIDEMRILLESKSIDILLTNESKIDDTVLDNQIYISGYNIIRNDRNRNGGGVMMYLKQLLSFTEQNDLVVDSLEMILKILDARPGFIINHCPNSYIRRIVST